MSGHAQLTKTGQRMLSDIAKLQARHHLFMEALNTDLDYYDEQASSGRLSKCALFVVVEYSGFSSSSGTPEMYFIITLHEKS